MTRSAFLGAFLGVAGMLMAASCAPPPPVSGQDRADAAKRVACRGRVDEIFAREDRGALARDDNQSLSPFSSDYVEGNPARGLPSRYAQDRAFDDCVSGTTDTGPPVTDETPPARRLVPGS